MIYPQIVPQWEISTCRILYFIIFALAAAALYWPFFGYTTRSYGFMMSAVVHLINALIAVSLICIWESGHRKTFQDILMIPSQQGLHIFIYEEKTFFCVNSQAVGWNS